MPTDVRTAFTNGSGPFKDVYTDTTISDTRIRGINSGGLGTFLITGVVSTAAAGAKGSHIKYVAYTSATEITVPSNGVFMAGPVYLSAPLSASDCTVFYG
jgi:hypothetical protein